MRNWQYLIHILGIYIPVSTDAMCNSHAKKKVPCGEGLARVQRRHCSAATPTGAALGPARVSAERSVLRVDSGSCTTACSCRERLSPPVHKSSTGAPTANPNGAPHTDKRKAQRVDSESLPQRECPHRPKRDWSAARPSSNQEKESVRYSRPRPCV